MLKAWLDAGEAFEFGVAEFSQLLLQHYIYAYQRFCKFWSCAANSCRRIDRKQEQENTSLHSVRVDCRVASWENTLEARPVYNNDVSDAIGHAVEIDEAKNRQEPCSTCRSLVPALQA